MRPAELTTDRLVLEPLRADHAREMVHVLADPELYAVIGGEPPTLGALRRRFETQARGASPDGLQRWLNWIVRRRAEGDAIGFVQATVDIADRSTDVAWVIGVPWQGRGYAVEAAGAMIDALDGLITAHIQPGHAASESVARRLGMGPTDVIEDGERVWQRPPTAGRTDPV